ncbi:MAG: right-handed parallel beta-helix repeat-containing protein [Thermofilaceae archaeon]|nr:right-handed parallel beta-helix repeat-containing protein [Thermofilaceae archaeon]MDW8003506.1 NosD domain-containing protein [Thermofilaceae archaeon]
MKLALKLPIVLILFTFLAACESRKEAAIRILPNGSVVPPEVPIKRVGDTYLLLENIEASGDGILVEKSGATLDGGLHVLSGSGSGIGVIIAAANVTVRNIMVQEFEYGVYVSDSPRCSIMNAHVTGGRVGIGLWRSTGCSIARNIVNKSRVGLFLEDSSGATIEDNVFEFSGLYVRRSYGNRVDGNVVNGRPIVYFEGASGVKVKGVVGQVVLVRCSNVSVSVSAEYSSVGILVSESSMVEVVESNLRGNLVGIDVWGSRSCIVRNCSLRDGEVGLRLAYSNNCLVEKLEVERSRFGIYLESSNLNSLKDSNLSECWGNGLLLTNSSENRILDVIISGSMFGASILSSNSNFFAQNAFWRNSYGVTINASQGNMFTGNDFVENKVHVQLVSQSLNSWDDGVKGNFYNDLWELRVSGRGSFDRVYRFDENNLDRYPLDEPTLIMPVTTVTQLGYASGSGWYLKGSFVFVEVKPVNLLLVSFDRWEDSAGRTVSREPRILLQVAGPTFLKAVWKVNYYAIAALTATITALYYLYRAKIRASPKARKWWRRRRWRGNLVFEVYED